MNDTSSDADVFNGTSSLTGRTAELPDYEFYNGLYWLIVVALLFFVAMGCIVISRSRFPHERPLPKRDPLEEYCQKMRDAKRGERLIRVAAQLIPIDVPAEPQGLELLHVHFCSIAQKPVMIGKSPEGVVSHFNWNEKRFQFELELCESCGRTGSAEGPEIIP